MDNYFFIFLALILPIMTGFIKTGKKGLLTGLFLSLLFVSKSSPYLFIVPVSVPLIILWQSRSRYSLPSPVSANTDEGSGIAQTGDSDSSQIPPARALPRFSMGPAFYHYILFTLILVILTAMNSGAVPYFNSSLVIISGAAGAIVFGLICDEKGPYIGALYLIFLQEVSVCIAAARVTAYSYTVAYGLTAFCTGGFFTVLPIISDIFRNHRPGIQACFLEIPVILSVWVLVDSLCRRAKVSLLTSGDFLTGLLILAALAITFLYASWKKRLFLVRGHGVRRS